jgi:hypothetical protein
MSHLGHFVRDLNAWLTVYLVQLNDTGRVLSNANFMSIAQLTCLKVCSSLRLQAGLDLDPSDRSGLVWQPG